MRCPSHSYCEVSLCVQQVIVLCGEGKNFSAGMEFLALNSVVERLGGPELCPGRARSSLMHTIRFMQVSFPQGAAASPTRTALQLFPIAVKLNVPSSEVA